MVFVYRDANWGAKEGTSAHKDSDKPKNTAERPNHLVSVNLAPKDRSALRRLPNGRSAGPVSTAIATKGESGKNAGAVSIVELVGAHGVTVIAVTADQELRAALTEVLPRNGIVFADSPQQVLSRAAPDNCAVLIVEHTLSRPAFEQLKSHLKSAAPALVNIMIGTHDDGSSLIGLLSAGWIDRFMVKPLAPGPTRIALRSALQQHHSLRSRIQVDLADDEQAKQDLVAIESVADVASDTPDSHTFTHHTPIHVEVQRNTHDQVARIDNPKISAVADPIIVEPACDAENDLQNTVDNVVEPSRESTVRAAATPRQLAQLPSASWPSLAFAAMIAMAALTILVAWAISTRAPEANANKAMVDKVVAGHLAAAQRAFELGSYVDPAELNATHFYNAALELDPTSTQAKRGLAAVADRLMAQGKQFISTGDLLRAQSALDNVRRVQPNHPELADVTASLLNARETERLTIQAARAPSTSIEPIVVTASLGAANLQKAVVLPVVAKQSIRIERKVANNSPRQARVLQAEPRAIDRIDSPVVNKLAIAAPAIAVPIVSAVDSSRLAPDSAIQSTRNTPANQESAGSNLNRTSEGKTEAVQDPAELRAAMKVEALREPAATESAISSTTGLGPSGPMDVAKNADNSNPALLKYVSPVYPYKARTTGIEGWLDVNFMVTSDGNVINPRIESGTLDTRFHRAALAAVTQWKFSRASNAAAPNRPMKGRLEFKLTE